eukprot:SAG31_NODE_426_length_15814_cov_25.737066_3_plen_178_part_00
MQGLNVAALPVAVLAILIYAQVKNVDPGETGTAEEKRAMIGSVNAPPPPKKASPVVGVLVACVAGVLFGACFNPAQHVIDQATANHCKRLTDECSCINYFDPDDRRIYCTWQPPVQTKNGTTHDHGACTGMPGPDLAFSQFCGIFMASFSILVVAGFYKQFIKNEDLYVNVPLILPV